jgi:hypothetical protein
VVAGMLYSAKPFDILRYKAKLGEVGQNILKQQSEKHGRVIHNVTCVFDLEKLSLQRHAWKPGSYAVNHFVLSSEDRILDFLVLPFYYPVKHM